ncbi:MULTISPECIES: transporter substrate-binding domain-containing protein [unclassified Pseudomonas]|uniref:transporter substrate-binding domain-containing protein n=1 Tax=unclassified Pseudomonas TaxID=196821 RepID=UPI0008713985|nr:MULTISPECIES: transporter substrate-binding domain-containing protein [unclassified Pseudomonas]SCW51742.1 cystine transport system substrate-binding protein [Pseudomonas sp. NFACC05-1]SCZ35256.1 cystine transport system substrate-binding protein [Pseudomonas sp. NFACC44-2]SDA82506.1 cystine transport system substrate-binding protein [Pseudomonas sp. NFACC51]SDW74942.1 cystine transport system substrate-binding protein [Pseudomonas sp. NFACC08-1]SEJ65973.1 cystine transport system substrate
MRFLPGLICLLPLLSPLAHAELIDDINDRGELRIALEANAAPFNFKEDGKLTGFEVELGEMLASELDVRPDFVVTDAGDLMSGVESGKYDVAINHIAMTPELVERFDTSAVYSQPDAQLLASKEQTPRPLVMAQSFQPEKKSDPAPSLVIPFQKGNPAFKASLDNALTRIKEDGRLERLSQKWLEKQPAENN